MTTPIAISGIRLSPDAQLALRLRDERFVLSQAALERLLAPPLRLPIGPVPAPVLR